VQAFGENGVTVESFGVSLGQPDPLFDLLRLVGDGSETFFWDQRLSDAADPAG